MFQKGRTKTGGRKAGIGNKIDAKLKERIAELVEGQFDNIVADLAELEPKDRVAAYQRFLEYVIPKQREQKTDVHVEARDKPHWLTATLDYPAFTE
ncbi:hypothetical protein [Rudanella paleaurantiibacter]|uniref:hypothetical protein n=1 Tax=Rudanella paleaurantiibacter TaxID=2614655 RepID=UPI0016257A68|nr:hypothetical protein [Rudanella paleaurantiibacter]